MSVDLILQKFSARFKLLASPAHLRIFHQLAVQDGLPASQLDRKSRRLLKQLEGEELVFLGQDQCYRLNRAVLRDLSDFVLPPAGRAAVEYPRPTCCWPHSA